MGGVVAFGACAADALLPTFDAPSEFVDGDVRVCVCALLRAKGDFLLFIADSRASFFCIFGRLFF